MDLLKREVIRQEEGEGEERKRDESTRNNRVADVVDSGNNGNLRGLLSSLRW